LHGGDKKRERGGSNPKPKKAQYVKKRSKGRKRTPQRGTGGERGEDEAGTRPGLKPTKGTGNYGQEESG